MSRGFNHYFWRISEFMGRAIFGGEQSTFSKRIMYFVAIPLGLICVLMQITWLGFLVMAILLGCLVRDFVEFNRDHPNG